MEVMHDQRIGTSASAHMTQSGSAASKLRSIRIEDVEARRAAPSWPTPVVALISTVLEDGDFEETYATMKSMVGSAYQPDINIILQLFAIVLNPKECLKSTAFGDTSQDILSSAPRAAALRAYQLLTAFIETNGHWRPLCNLPRVAQIPDLPARRKSVLDVVAEKREDLTEFTRGELAARKLDRYKDVWEIIASKGDADEDESQDLLSSQGLRVLDLLLSAWETEAEVEKAEGRLPASHFLLSQIRKPSTGLPNDFRSILDFIFQRKPGAADSPAYQQEADLRLRLLHLMAQLAEADRVDSTSFFNDIAERMRSLGNADFRDFVATALLQAPNSRIRLFGRYIDKYCAPPPVLFEVDDSPPLARKKSQPHEVLSDYELEIMFVKTVASSPSKDVVPSSQTESLASKRTPSQTSSASISTPTASPRRIGQGSQSASPSKKAAVPPILTSAKKAISTYFDKMPRELDPSRPVKRMPKREGESQPAPSAVTSRVIEVEVRFSLLKLEILQMLVAQARRSQDGHASNGWKKVVESGKLQRAFRSGRKHLMKDGELPKQVQQIQDFEDAIFSTIA